MCIGAGLVLGRGGCKSRLLVNCSYPLFYRWRRLIVFGVLECWSGGVMKKNEPCLAPVGNNGERI